MIARYDDDGTLILVTQNDHAKLAGVLAAHWGNLEFEKPVPYHSVVRAAMLHDFGWSRYETQPHFEEATGKTPSYRQVRNDGPQLDALQWGLDWVAGIDPYSGVLVSKHRTGLWQGRYGVITNPPAIERGTPPPDIQRFIKDNESRQENDESGIDPKELKVNYWLLQVWDYLSLHFCTEKTPGNFVIDPVPRGYSDDCGVRLELIRASRNRITVAPFPFDQGALEISFVYRRIDNAQFRSTKEFLSAYYGAPLQVAKFELSSQV
jgi:hypothetical protein